MQNIEQKQKQISFYELIQGKNKFDLKGALDFVYNSFMKRNYSKIQELTIEDVRYYISAIQKVYLEGIINYGEDSVEYYGYALNIAKVDSSQQIKYGDLTKVVDKRAEVIDLSDDDVDMSQVGPLFDTQLFIDPFYSVVAMGRTVGGTNIWALKKFMQQLFDTKGLRLAFIPDEKTIEDIDNMTLLTCISYKVAKTGNAEEQKDDSRSEIGDVKLANHLSADEYEMRLKSISLDKKNAKSKIKQIFSRNEFDEVKSIKLEGIRDGQEVFFSLLKNKLSYHGAIQFDKLKGITVRNNFDYLAKAYASKSGFIENNLSVKVYEDPNESENTEK